MVRIILRKIGTVFKVFFPFFGKFFSFFGNFFPSRNSGNFRNKKSNKDSANKNNSIKTADNFGKEYQIKLENW